MENGPFTADLPLKMVDLSIVFCRFTRPGTVVIFVHFKSTGHVDPMDSDGILGFSLWISKRSTVCCLSLLFRVFDML
jgi:hypothetical protein